MVGAHSWAVGDGGLSCGEEDETAKDIESIEC